MVELAARHGLGDQAAGRLWALLGALEAEDRPPTAVGPGEALDLHLADSLSGLEVPELAEAPRIADVGAGAGFPGLALAAARRDAEVDLIEASARKCAVIARLAAAASLPHARAVAARAEEWGAGEGTGAYGAVTARAVAPLAVLVEYAAPLLAAGGVLVAWKGTRDPGEERAGAVAAGIVGLEPVEVRPVAPFAEARSLHLHVFAKVAPTPGRFPRRPGMARKRALA